MPRPVRDYSDSSIRVRHGIPEGMTLSVSSTFILFLQHVLSALDFSYILQSQREILSHVIVVHIQDMLRGIRQALRMHYSNDFKQKKSCECIRFHRKDHNILRINSLYF